GKLGNEREVAAIAEKLAAAGTDVAAPVPATLPLAPADAAPSRGLPGWSVLAAIVAGGVLVWLLAGGRSGRRGDDGDDGGGDDGAGEDGGGDGGPAAGSTPEEAVDTVLARPHEAVASARHSRKPEVFQVEKRQG
ncbi:MAG: hypothetical protein ACKO5R_07580, partial [Planctomycetaceae bacterium]